MVRRWSNASWHAGLPPGMIAEIVERTDGVPLFVEELTKAVLEAGPSAAAGRLGAPAGLLVPATLHASLMARLDRLGPAGKTSPRSAPRSAANFSYELAASVGGHTEEMLQNALQRLVDAGLVFQRGMPPEAVYRSSTPWSRIRPTARCCAAPDGNCMPGSPKRS